MAFSMQLRRKRDINWRELCYGEQLCLKKEKVERRAVLPEEYKVERLISRKRVSNRQTLYLVKWEGYADYEWTWEPESHLSDDIIRSFNEPEISEQRLLAASRDFECAVQQRLRGKENTVVVRFDLDIYRHCFGTLDKKQLNTVDDLSKLPLVKDWYYRLNSRGRGLKLSFPCSVKPNLYMRKVYVAENRCVVMKQIPIETLRLVCATEVCHVEEL